MRTKSEDTKVKSGGEISVSAALSSAIRRLNLSCLDQEMAPLTSISSTVTDMRIKHILIMNRPAMSVCLFVCVSVKNI
jgi:hypothetical protein